MSAVAYPCTRHGLRLTASDFLAVQPGRAPCQLSARDQTWPSLTACAAAAVVQTEVSCRISMYQAWPPLNCLAVRCRISTCQAWPPLICRLLALRMVRCRISTCQAWPPLICHVLLLAVVRCRISTCQAWPPLICHLIAVRSTGVTIRPGR